MNFPTTLKLNPNTENKQYGQSILVLIQPQTLGKGTPLQTVDLVSFVIEFLGLF